MKTTIIAVLTTCSLFVASSASAQQDSQDIAIEQPIPMFTTMDWGDALSRALIMASFSVDDSAEAWRFDFHGQYVHKQRFGGYISVPLSHRREDADIGLPSTEQARTKTGNLELGGLYNGKISGRTSFVLRGGAVLPTGHDEQPANQVNPFVRTTDMIAMRAQTASLRASASLIGRRGVMFFRVDGGFDVPISSPDNGVDGAVFRLNTGIGAETGPIMMLAELTNTSGESEFINNFALTTTVIHFGSVQLGATVIVPFDDLEELSLAFSLGGFRR